jgi:flavodoxin
MKIMILYFSKTGHTLEAANATAEGLRSAGAEVDLVALSDFAPEAIAQYDGLIVGSPCWAGSLPKSGVAKPLRKVLESLPANCLKGKRCGGISVHASKGGATTVGTLGRLTSQKVCEDYRPGPVAKGGSAMSLWKGPSVNTDDQERFKTFGEGFVA